MNHHANNLCPSSTGTEGSVLLGVVQGDKTVALLQKPLEVNQSFIDEAKKSGPLEKRFRFANKCVKGGCRQWTGSHCGVMDLLAKANQHIKTDEVLKPCPIRKRCRWFSQEGEKACTLCTFVVTNNMEESEIMNIPKPRSIQKQVG
jgi:hypothetical protein